MRISYRYVVVGVITLKMMLFNSLLYGESYTGAIKGLVVSAPQDGNVVGIIVDSISGCERLVLENDEVGVQILNQLIAAYFMGTRKDLVVEYNPSHQIGCKIQSVEWS